MKNLKTYKYINNTPKYEEGTITVNPMQLGLDFSKPIIKPYEIETITGPKGGFKSGVPIPKTPNGKLSFNEISGMALPALSGVGELTNSITSALKPEGNALDNSNVEADRENNFANIRQQVEDSTGAGATIGSFASGAAAGGKIGNSIFGPVGGWVGGLLGGIGSGIASLFGAKSAKLRMEEKLQRSGLMGDLRDMLKQSSDFSNRMMLEYYVKRNNKGTITAADGAGRFMPSDIFNMYTVGGKAGTDKNFTYLHTGNGVEPAYVSKGEVIAQGYDDNGNRTDWVLSNKGRFSPADMVRAGYDINDALTVLNMKQQYKGMKQGPAKYSYGTPNLYSIFPALSGMIAGQSLYREANNAPIQTYDAYRSNPYANQSLAIKASNRIDPSPYMQAMRRLHADQMARSSYMPLSGGQYINMASNLYGKMLNQIPEVMNSINELNMKYRSDYSDALYKYGDEDRSKRMDALAQKYEWLREDNAAKWKNRWQAVANTLDPIYKGFANLNNNFWTGKNIDLWYQDILNKRAEIEAKMASNKAKNKAADKSLLSYKPLLANKPVLSYTDFMNSTNQFVSDLAQKYGWSKKSNNKRKNRAKIV